MKQRVPVTFSFKNKQYSGFFSQVMGAGSTATFYLEVGTSYWGRLRFSTFSNQFEFDPTPKTEELAALVADFEFLMISHFQ